MTEKERRLERRKHRVLSVIGSNVPVSPDGFRLIEIVRLKSGKVNYVYAERDEKSA